MINYTLLYIIINHHFITAFLFDSDWWILILGLF
jgi:hypothetical protein